MASVTEVLNAAAARLSSVSDTPRLDAELLMAHALDAPRETVLLARLEDPAPDAFAPLVERRLAHEPVAYIIGRRGFWTIELEVAHGVLIPRPDTETLLDAAVAHFGNAGPKTILDLGTGSGALLLAALDQWPDARGLGLDTSDRAIDLARRNAERLGLASRAKIDARWWAMGVRARFDLILCKPPYVEASFDLPPTVRDWEPHSALFAGTDGLDCYRQLAPQISKRLAPGGIACVEIGATQAVSAGALFEAQGLAVSVRKDLAARDRCLILGR